MVSHEGMTLRPSSQPCRSASTSCASGLRLQCCRRGGEEGAAIQAGCRQAIAARPETASCCWKQQAALSDASASEELGKRPCQRCSPWQGGIDRVACSLCPLLVHRHHRSACTARQPVASHTVLLLWLVPCHDGTQLPLSCLVLSAGPAACGGTEGGQWGMSGVLGSNLWRRSMEALHFSLRG